MTCKPLQDVKHTGSNWTSPAFRGLKLRSTPLAGASNPKWTTDWQATLRANFLNPYIHSNIHDLFKDPGLYHCFFYILICVNIRQMFVIP